MIRRCILAVLVACPACATPSTWPDPPAVRVPPAEGPDHRADAERLRALLDSGQTDVATIVWFGRRLAYLGSYEDAIAVYSRGLELHPAEPHLLRHRGHRYITTGRFDLAVEDLELAAAEIVDRPDEIEPDGMPNARGIPTGTLRTNVYYHLALARRLRGEDERALVAWQRCLAAATTIDTEVAARYWLCLTLWRLGRPIAARAIVDAVAVDADIIENHAYHRLCLLLSDRATVDEVLGAGTGAPSGTVTYGVAMWCLTEGRVDEAEDWLRQTVADGAPTAFGRIAAAADLARFAGNRD